MLAPTLASLAAGVASLARRGAAHNLRHAGIKAAWIPSRTSGKSFMHEVIPTAGPSWSGKCADQCQPPLVSEVSGLGPSSQGTDLKNSTHGVSTHTGTCSKRAGLHPGSAGTITVASTVAWVAVHVRGSALQNMVTAGESAHKRKCAVPTTNGTACW